MSKPLTRLLIRAAAAGIAAGLAAWQLSPDYAIGAVVAGALAVIEVFTPVNPGVGFGKNAYKRKPK